MHDAPTGTDRTPEYLTPAEALAHAIEIAADGPAYGPNPRVGCVVLAPGEGADPRRVLATGIHRGAGTPHAEAAALTQAADAGVDVTGASVFVSLEPCDHQGRTGPCSEALLAAGVAEVTFAVPDPSTVAAGGAAHLAAAGVTVVGPTEADDGAGHELVRAWLHSVTTGRPFVTLKMATTLDGRVAAADGTSRWVTSETARHHAHERRAEVDAILVGTGTVLADDPALTARAADARPDGSTRGVHQPLRVVLGRTEIPREARLRTTPGGRLVHLRTHDVHEALAELAALEVRHVLVEGGPRVAAQFLRAGLVDEVHAYVAPVLLGAGRPAVADLGLTSISQALRLEPTSVEVLGPDVLVVSRPRRASSDAHAAPLTKEH